MAGFSSSQLGLWDANNGGPGIASGVGFSGSGSQIERGGPNFQVKEGGQEGCVGRSAGVCVCASVRVG